PSIPPRVACPKLFPALPFGLNYLAFPGITPFLPTSPLGWSADPHDSPGLYQDARNDTVLLSVPPGNIAPPDRPPRHPAARVPRHARDRRLLGADSDTDHRGRGRGSDCRRADRERADRVHPSH